jgi:Protein of unknown function (DUF664)
MVKDLVDPRRAEPPPDGLGEREMLGAWLEFHRTTLPLKCEGLDDHARKARPVPTSQLSLHGLVRHMAEVERSWFRRVLQREPGAPFIFFDAAAGRDLGDTGRTRAGEPCSLRWIYAHMIEEYARHNGPADLIRELTDGAVGC